MSTCKNDSTRTNSCETTRKHTRHWSHKVYRDEHFVYKSMKKGSVCLSLNILHGIFSGVERRVKEGARVFRHTIAFLVNQIIVFIHNDIQSQNTAEFYQIPAWVLSNYIIFDYLDTLLRAHKHCALLYISTHAQKTRFNFQGTTTLHKKKN